MKIASVKLTTTARCPLRCPACSVEAWRDLNPRYDMTLEQVHRFVEALRADGLRIGELIVSGGEPMLWKPLPQAMTALRPYCDTIRMFTNGMIEPDEPFVRATAEIDEVRVSVFKANADRVERLRAWARCRVKAKKKERFWTRPEAPVPGSVPADCRCPHLEVCGDRVFACSLVQHNAADDREPVPAGMVTDVSPGFLHRLNLRTVAEMPMCARCVGNKRIKCARVGK